MTISPEKDAQVRLMIRNAFESLLRGDPEACGFIRIDDLQIDALATAIGALLLGDDAEAGDTDYESTRALIAACDRLLWTEKDIAQMPAEQRDWFMGKPGHRDCFIVAAALKQILVKSIPPMKPHPIPPDVERCDLRPDLLKQEAEARERQRYEAVRTSKSLSQLAEERREQTETAIRKLDDMDHEETCL